MSEHVEIRRQGHVLLLRLVRPEKRNAITAPMYAALAAAIADADADSSVRAIALCGSAGCFTAGNDLADFLAAPPIEPDAAVFRFLDALSAASVPLVAGVDGDAVGIGTTVLLHCDIVLVTERARLRLPFVDLGIVPEAGSTWLLPKIMGHARAAELMMLCEGFDGRRAVELGIANRLVSPDALEGETYRIAEALATKPTRAMRQTKQLLKADHAAVTRAIAAEAACFAELMVSPEAREAFSAFVEKRKALMPEGRLTNGAS